MFTNSKIGEPCATWRGVIGIRESQRGEISWIVVGSFREVIIREDEIIRRGHPMDYRCAQNSKLSIVLLTKTVAVIPSIEHRGQLSWHMTNSRLDMKKQS